MSVRRQMRGGERNAHTHSVVFSATPTANVYINRLGGGWEEGGGWRGWKSIQACQVLTVGTV